MVKLGFICGWFKSCLVIVIAASAPTILAKQKNSPIGVIVALMNLKYVCLFSFSALTTELILIKHKLY